MQSRSFESCCLLSSMKLECPLMLLACGRRPFWYLSTPLLSSALSCKKLGTAQGMLGHLNGERRLPSRHSGLREPYSLRLKEISIYSPAVSRCCEEWRPRVGRVSPCTNDSVWELWERANYSRSGDLSR